MIRSDFNNSGESRHKCYSEKEGDWIVFKCPVCSDYERRIHSKTGEMKSKYNSDNRYRHSGTFVPIGLDADMYLPN